MGVEHSSSSAGKGGVDDFQDEEEYYWSEEEEDSEATNWFLHGFMNRPFEDKTSDSEATRRRGARGSVLYTLPEKGPRLDAFRRFSPSSLPQQLWIEVLSFVSTEERCNFRLVSLSFNEIVLGSLVSIVLKDVPREEGLAYKDFLAKTVRCVRTLSAGTSKLSSLLSFLAYSHRSTLETLRCGSLATPTLLSQILPKLVNLKCVEIQLESYPIQPTEALPETVRELRILDTFDDDGETISVWVDSTPGLERLGLECGYEPSWESFSHPLVEEIWGRGHSKAVSFRSDSFLHPFVGREEVQGIGEDGDDGLIRFPDEMMDDLERYFPSVRRIRGVKGQFVLTSRNVTSVVVEDFRKVEPSLPLLWNLDELVLKRSPLEALATHRRLQSLVLFDSRIEHLELVLNNMPNLRRLVVVSSFFLKMPQSLNLENVVHLHIEPPYVVWPPKRLCRYLRTHAPQLRSFGLRYQMPLPPSSDGLSTVQYRFHTEPLVLWFQFIDQLQTLRLVEPVRRHQEIYRVSSKKTFFGCLNLRKIVFINEQGVVLKRVFRFTPCDGTVYWKENLVSFEELEEDGSWNDRAFRLRKLYLKDHPPETDALDDDDSKRDDDGLASSFPSDTFDQRSGISGSVDYMGFEGRAAKKGLNTDLSRSFDDDGTGEDEDDVGEFATDGVDPWERQSVTSVSDTDSLGQHDFGNETGLGSVPSQSSVHGRDRETTSSSLLLGGTGPSASDGSADPPWLSSRNRNGTRKGDSGDSKGSVGRVSSTDGIRRDVTDHGGRSVHFQDTMEKQDSRSGRTRNGGLSLNRSRDQIAASGSGSQLRKELGSQIRGSGGGGLRGTRGSGTRIGKNGGQGILGKRTTAMSAFVSHGSSVDGAQDGPSDRAKRVSSIDGIDRHSRGNRRDRGGGLSARVFSVDRLSDVGSSLNGGSHKKKVVSGGSKGSSVSHQPKRKHAEPKTPPRVRQRRDALPRDGTGAEEIPLGDQYSAVRGNVNFDDLPAGVGARRRHLEDLKMRKDNEIPFDAGDSEDSEEDDQLPPRHHDLGRDSRLRGLEEVATTASEDPSQLQLPSASATAEYLRSSYDPASHGMLKGVFIFERPLGQPIGMPVDHSTFSAEKKRFSSDASVPSGTSERSVPGTTPSSTPPQPSRGVRGRLKELDAGRRGAGTVSGPKAVRAGDRIDSGLQYQSTFEEGVTPNSGPSLAQDAVRSRRTPPSDRSQLRGDQRRLAHRRGRRGGDSTSGQFEGNGGESRFPSIRRRPSFGDDSALSKKKSHLVDGRGERIPMDRDALADAAGFPNLDDPALRQLASGVDFSALEKLEADAEARGEPIDPWLKELRRLEVLRRAWEKEYAHRCDRRKQRELEVSRISQQQHLIRIRMAQAELEEKRLREEAGRKKRRWLAEQRNLLRDRIDSEQKGLEDSRVKYHRNVIRGELSRRQQQSQDALRVLLEEDVRRKAEREVLAEHFQNQELLQSTVSRLVNEEMRKSRHHEEEEIRRLLQKRYVENREKESLMNRREEDRRRVLAESEGSETLGRRRKDLRRRRRVEFHAGRRSSDLRKSNRRAYDREEEKRLVKFLASRQRAKRRQ